MVTNVSAPPARPRPNPWIRVMRSFNTTRARMTVLTGYSELIAATQVKLPESRASR